MSKYLFSFGDKKTKKITNARNILGGKGANLAEMARLGLPVPPGFTISTQMCEIFTKIKKNYHLKHCKEIKKELKKIEFNNKKKFGDNFRSITCICKIWFKSVHARNDGYYFEFRIK